MENGERDYGRPIGSLESPGDFERGTTGRFIYSNYVYSLMYLHGRAEIIKPSIFRCERINVKWKESFRVKSGRVKSEVGEN